MNEETKKKIEEKASNLYHIHFPNATNHIERNENHIKSAQKDAYIDGANFGYSLAEDEIERLKNIIETLHSEWKGISPVLWLQFKEQHKL